MHRAYTRYDVGEPSLSSFDPVIAQGTVPLSTHGKPPLLCFEAHGAAGGCKLCDAILVRHGSPHGARWRAMAMQCAVMSLSWR